MAYRKNQTNSQIVALALRGIEGETTTGNMSTERIVSTYYAYRTGNMPNVWAALYAERVREAKADRVIYSYSTPIAWLDRDYGWVIPSVTYSTTTSTRHQTHLWRLGGTTYYMPWDATAEDARRVLAGELVFLRNRRGIAYATVPGPNYRRESVATKVTARDASGVVYSYTKVD